MQSPQSATLDTLGHVQTFLDANATLVSSVITTTLRAELDNVVTQLSARAVEQDTTTATSIGETYNQGVMRQQIRSRYMRPIARMAAMQLRTVPEYPALTVPAHRLPLGPFIVAAQAMIAAAMDNATVLVNAGMTTDLIPSFTTAVTALSASVENRGRSRARRAASTAGLVNLTRTGRGLIEVIDAFIEPVIAGNAQIVAEWQSSSRIAAKPGPTAKKPVTPAPVTPATPVVPEPTTTATSASTSNAEGSATAA